ncbi:MAG: DNA-3-methyladenine glycosylase family protein [Actinomycetota bacterium]
MKRADIRLPLKGAGGEPVSFERTVLSHGVAGLPPMSASATGDLFGTTLALNDGRPRTVRITRDGKRNAVIEVAGRAPGPRTTETIRAAAAHVLRLDEDLSELYALAADDPDLSWVCAGAGRMIRSQTVFEDVVKTICTTNCSWSLTQRMVGALVEHLGDPAPGAPAEGPAGRTFPTPAAMAAQDERFYREVVRAGYRAPYLQALATSVAEGDVDLEAWGRAGVDELPDDELFTLLIGLPGVGPYAAAHAMMMIGRYSRLILDSWTRPTYARLVRRRVVKDPAIQRRFKRYGPYAGLAFWLFLTRGWVENAAEAKG